MTYVSPLDYLDKRSTSLPWLGFGVSAQLRGNVTMSRFLDTPPRRNRVAADMWMLNLAASRLRAGWTLASSLLLIGVPIAQAEPVLSTGSYATIQAALDAHPGQMLFVPGGDHILTNTIVIRHSGSGLYGFGRLVQKRSDSAVIAIQSAKDVRLRDLTLTRAPGQEAASQPAIDASDCERLSISGLRVLDNCAPNGAISLQHCTNSDVSDCHIENYSTIAVDDRTASAHYGYAFNCIDGTGIAANNCSGLLIQRNTIIEQRLRPTPKIKERHNLGQFIKRSTRKGSIISQKTWDDGYVNNWHQGSAVIVTGPEKSSGVRIQDNHIENAAQGIDIHADNVIVTGNLVKNAFMGLKAMHGSRHVIVAHNQFIRTDLWAIGLMPGTAAHPAMAARDGHPPRAANRDAGHIIANNIITDFGYGDSHWIWHMPKDNCTPLRFDNGQEPDDPPLCDVVVTGNLVYDTGRDELFTNGVPVKVPPRYRWTVFVSPATNGPVALKFSNNLFHPGTDGVANVPLD